jgi:hypothetical protein
MSNEQKPLPAATRAVMHSDQVVAQAVAIDARQGAKSQRKATKAVVAADAKMHYQEMNAPFGPHATDKIVHNQVKEGMEGVKAAAIEAEAAVAKSQRPRKIIVKK